MTIEEKIEFAKKYVPEIADTDIELVKRLYELIEKKHTREEEKLLVIYYLGYILTSNEDINFEEIQISNVVLKEGATVNSYLDMYRKLLDLMGLNNENDATVSIV